MQPCHIVQINSSVRSRNLVTDLSDEFIESQRGWSIDSSYQSVKKRLHPCTYMKITNAGAIDNSNVGKHKSATTRDQAVTSYFSSLYSDSFESHTSENYEDKWKLPNLSTLKPYCVEWKDVAIHVMHQQVLSDVILHAFNLSLVCLAHVEERLIVKCNDDNPEEQPRRLTEQPKAEYLGLGIVRNINMEDHAFYILTPEPPEVLERVNALLKGNIQLPANFLKEDDTSDHPYYCYDYVSVGMKVASGMKPRFNLKRKPSRMKNSFVER